jgi:hypothetical protein
MQPIKTLSLIPVVSVCAVVSAGGTFVIVRSTIDGGGGAMRSPDETLEVRGTMGQPDAGMMSGGDFELIGGFWFGIPPADCNDDGLVNSSDTRTFVPCMSGPATAPSTACRCFDVDRNDRVDLADFASMQIGFQRD